MKKLLIISALLVTGFATKSNAQHFIASFGVERHWGVPDYVTHIVYDRYYNYDWVHARRMYAPNGSLYFNVLLQRGNRFVEVNINNHGHYNVVNRYNYYPLAGHICGDFCGYHEYYYNTYNNICHSHNHWGHNHIVYRPRPVTYVWGHYRNVYRPNTTVIYNNAPAKKYKQHKKGNHKPQYTDGKNPYRIRLEDRYPTRRSSTQPVNTHYRESTARQSDGGRQYHQESSRTSTQKYGRNSRSDQQYGRDSRNSRQYKSDSREEEKYEKSSRSSRGRSSAGTTRRGRGN